MLRILNARERKALNALSLDHQSFVIKGALPVGIGGQTLDALLELGLIEQGPSERHYGEIGYRITADGWRCMYGKAYVEIMGSGEQAYPLKVWSWPPSYE